MSLGEQVANEASSEPMDEGKANPKFWAAQIQAGKDAGKRHRQQTKRAVDEYLANQNKPETNSETPQVEARYPIWWSTLRTVQPAVYSRTPITITQKAFTDLDDIISRQSAIYLERLGEYLIRCNPFDRVHYAARDTYLWSDRTTTRVRFDSKFNQVTLKTRYTPAQTIDDSGASALKYVNDAGYYADDDAEIQQDEEGYYSEHSEDELDYAKVEIEPIHYADLVHTPNARTWEEIDWVAFKLLLTRADVSDRFDSDDEDEEKISAALSYSPLGDKDEREDVKTTAETYCTVWEIWDKRKKRVYWLADGYSEKFLDDKEDPYSLIGFFPCPPFMLGTCGPDSLYPVPAYIQMEPFINQLHSAAKTLQVYIRALRRRGFADSGVPDFDNLLNQADATEFLMIENFAQLVKDGGLENILRFFPTSEYATAVTEMIAAIQNFEDKFNELYGVPDILRGVSDPRETAAAQQQKGKFLSLRFSAIQREFQRVIRDGIELMCDLALKMFPEQMLVEVMGIQFEKPEHQQIWPQCLALMKNDRQRMVRIDIETDSTITMNQNAEIEQLNYVAKSLNDGIQAIAAVSQSAPEYVPVAAEAVRLIVNKLQQGKKVEGPFNEAMKRAMQPKQPAPDPAMQKVQAQMQVEQQKAQAQIQVAQMKAQTDAQLAMQKAQLEMELARRQSESKMMLEQQDAQNQQQLAAVEVQTAVIKAQMEAQLEEKKANDKATSDKMKLIGDIATKRMAGPEKAPPPPMTVNFKPTIHGGK